MRSPIPFLLGAALILGVALIARGQAAAQALFATNGYEPHGVCYLWQPGLIQLHAGTDTLIGLAYVSISATLGILVHRARRDIPFGWIFVAFGVFIVTCAATHFLGVITLWEPIYWFSGAVKVVTAAASVGTALVLPAYVPRTLGLIDSAKVSEERRVQLEEANEELAVLYERTRELDDLKTQFFANISHELRTPLTLILGPLDRLLTSGDLTEEQRRDLSVIQGNARSLLKHVNDLLDLTRLDAGQYAVTYADVDAAALVRSTASHFETLARDREMDYAVETPPTLPAQVDPAKFEQVLTNLLGNAFKFTPAAGKVRCLLDAVGDRIRLRVRDSGPGVPAALRSVIFDRFRQAEAGPTREHGGTGLGLAIAQEFTRLLGGTIEVGDAPEGGAEFVVCLPRLAPAGTSVQAAPDPRPSPTTILDDLRREGERPPGPAAILSTAGEQPLVLVVEDNRDMNRFLVGSLAGVYRVATAFDGQAGFDAARLLRPDLIVTDLMMPRLTGDDLVRAIRESPDIRDIPIVVLSARADETRRVQTLRDGAQDYLVKPFSVEELQARLKNLLDLKQAQDVLRQELATQGRDVTALARELADRGRELRAALTLRDEFLSVAAHELKTPITSLRLSAQMLLRVFPRGGGRDDEETGVDVGQRLRTIDEQTRRIGHLIEQLFDLSRVTAGRLEIDRRELDLRDLVKSTAEAFRPRAAGRDIHVTTPGRLLVQVDPLRFEQVLNNLLDNAMKYSPPGSPIAVEVAAGLPGAVEVVVTDRGSGIPPDRRDQIFERYFQAHQADHTSGLGLGLYLSRQIVELHGGGIRAEFPPEGGTRVVVTLPRDAEGTGA